VADAALLVGIREGARLERLHRRERRGEGTADEGVSRERVVGEDGLREVDEEREGRHVEGERLKALPRVKTHGARLSFRAEAEVKMAPKGPGRVALGIDLGGTKVLAGVVDETGRVVGRGKLKTPFLEGAESIGEAVVAAAQLALKEAGIAPSRVEAAGLAAPGAVDAEKGVLIRAGNLSAKNWKILDVLRAPFPSARLRLENDVRLAALGEARLGAGRGAATMVAVWVGTGVGGAVIREGKIHAGHNRNAGEIGMTRIDFRRVRKGSVDGTLESIAAKVGITAWLRRRIEEGEKTILADAVSKKDARLKGSQLKAAVEAGDALALRAVARSAKAVGLAMANVFNVLSPDLFVLGGGVATDVGEAYLDAVRKWAKAFAFSEELGSLRVEPAALGDDAGVLGAALYARE
jgi:glucokinase